ncbi:MAG: DUF721 domain-containing protein [Candidatus Tokpelaia sp.]|uniref:DUF721 domain-containing protein n=1 Tax=Candidatus Tokpelaia sp. TaxID=2233777 RepID=UPI00123B5EA5|nr:DciA family protein [Candidatus Tokpelaia sp.]KAA6204737.1 MAG: DUF721 domain-containing protein [Candidatus Tokpelaia sp.]KAA6207217.1 MAG: DUF721 domain-containing protein [Candidatus Tokpelaia sp.]KAA6405276.1 DUF721 domain-containing protein [Candidatus Tokpelaia sp.]
MTKQKSKNGFLPLSAATAGIMEPVLQKKAGLNRRLIQNWTEIVGQAVAAVAVPVKIIWPQPANKATKSNLAAATLILACFGYRAVKLQHETSEIIARINRFFGYQAIAKIRIELKIPFQAQPPVPRRGSSAAALPWAKTAFGFAAAKAPAVMPDKVQADIAEITDEALRASLLRLGQALYRG